MALDKGTTAPDVTLKTKTAEGLQDVHLSENFGKRKTVLLFFPFAFSDPCTKEMCGVNESFADYEKLGAAVYGVSVDTPFALEAFAQKNGIKFPLLSDFNREASRAYDVLFEDVLGFRHVAKRSAFVIDTDGRIAFSSSSDDPKQFPDFEGVKAALGEN